MEGLNSLFNALGLRRLIVMGLTAVAVISGIVYMSARMDKADMGILFTDLPPAQARAITETLGSMKVPYQLTPDGSAVLAPIDRLAELRIQLAGQQMTGQIGYELLDQQDALGTTAFLQNVNHIRAIEGELARSIESLNPVQRARVHLVLPKRALFEREKAEPSAAITLRLRTPLGSAQVSAIRNLVAAAAPELNPDRVSIVDQDGNLLAQSGDGSGSSSTALEERRVNIESRLRQQIESMLERIVGPGKVRAEIAAELDMEAVRKESEIYDPDAQVISSQTTFDANEQNNDSEKSNDVTVAAQLPDAQFQQTPTNSSTSTANELREQTLYANSKTRTTTMRDSGAVRKLTVSVVVDGTTTTDEEGNQSWTPRTQDELEQFQRLVENAIGFTEERGDRVVVENLQFAKSDPTEFGDDSPLPLGMQTRDLVKLAQTFVMGLLVLIGVLFVIRPMLRAMSGPTQTTAKAAEAAAQAAAEEQLALAPPNRAMVTAELLSRAAEGDEDARRQIEDLRQQNNGLLPVETEIDVAQIEGRIKSAALKKVGEVINRHPTEAAAIVRQWMYS